MVFLQESAIRLKLRAITAGIKKHKSIVKKKKHDKIVLLAKSELIRTEALISKFLIDSNTSQDEFVSINNVLKEYEVMKEEIQNLRLNRPLELATRQVYRIF